MRQISKFWRDLHQIVENLSEKVCSLCGERIDERVRKMMNFEETEIMELCNFIFNTQGKIINTKTGQKKNTSENTGSINNTCVRRAGLVSARLRCVKFFTTRCVSALPWCVDSTLLTNEDVVVFVIVRQRRRVRRQLRGSRRRAMSRF